MKVIQTTRKTDWNTPNDVCHGSWQKVEFSDCTCNLCEVWRCYYVHWVRKNNLTGIFWLIFRINIFKYPSITFTSPQNIYDELSNKNYNDIYIYVNGLIILRCRESDGLPCCMTILVHININIMREEANRWLQSE